MEVPLYFYLAFKDLKRLAPGSDSSTLTVLNMLNVDKDSELNILDVGCGVGTDTILLAEYFKNSTIEAVDLFPHYLSSLNKDIKENSLDSRVFAYQMDMNDLDFANEEIDILFCHAGAEIIGFKKALNLWKRIVKEGGFLICSDLTWISKPSKESMDFWKDSYPEIDTVENKISQIEKSGFTYISHFKLEKTEFRKYYSLLESNLNEIRCDKSAQDFIKQLDREIKVSSNEDFTYVYYIMQK